MAVAQLSVDQLWSQLQKHLKSVNYIVVALLCIYLLAYAADLLWRLVPAPEDSTNAVSINRTLPGNNRAKQQIDINAIQQLNLFGDATEKPVEAAPVVQEAPETNLNLTLTGLVASTVDKDGAAIIDNRGQQNTYGIGDEVDGTKATVSEVLRDRIIINNGGRMETLMLDGHEFNAAAQAQRSPKPNPVIANRAQDRVRKPSVQTLAPATADAARALRSSPSKFTDFISIQPNREAGKITGYKVNPGRNPALFQEVGLKPGDVLTEINGLDLSDFRQSTEAMKMLRSADSLQITLSRKGEITSLELELPAPAGN